MFKILEWPVGIDNDITFEIALEFCTAGIEASVISILCGDLANFNMKIHIDSCVEDIKVIDR